MPEEATGYSSAINTVTAVCKDAEEGFRGAATAVQNATPESLFNGLSSQRAEFATELRSVAETAGLKTEYSSGVLGTLHRGWTALKGVLTGHSDHQTLEETERDEDFSISRYRDALSHQLPVSLRILLETRYPHVRQAHNRIKELRDASAK